MTDEHSKERPIIFSGEMVRAILDGRKMQTRRVVKPQPDFFEPDATWLAGAGHSGDGWYVASGEYPDEGSEFYACPYGKPGNRLWVRETWLQMDRDHWSVPDSLPAGEGPRGIVYRASCKTTPDGEQARLAYGYKWRPSIHMPRWASRITLAVTGVQVERLKNIGQWGARAEGVRVRPDGRFGCFCCTSKDELGFVIAKHAFGHMWNRINAKRGFGWDTNPWVWVIEFRRLTND